MKMVKIRGKRGCSVFWVSALWFLTRIGESSETPSDICQQIVRSFGSAVSNFTLCSITNARPIHLCGLCVKEYVQVCHTHHVFSETTDEKGNLCQEYFTNLDRIEIVSEAYKYVHHLWKKANCDYCFQKFPNGTMDPEPTEDTRHFEFLYHETRECFDLGLENNETCLRCSKFYNKLNTNYIELSTKYGENICLDIVDTMNTTREEWSQMFNCTREKRYEIWLHVGFALIACIPVIFYILALVLSNKQEAKVMQQKRLAEVFSINSSLGTDREPEEPDRPTFFPRERALR